MLYCQKVITIKEKSKYETEFVQLLGMLKADLIFDAVDRHGSVYYKINMMFPYYAIIQSYFKEKYIRLCNGILSWDNFQEIYLKNNMLNVNLFNSKSTISYALPRKFDLKFENTHNSILIENLEMFEG